MRAAIYARKSTDQTGVADERRSVVRVSERAADATDRPLTEAEERVARALAELWVAAYRGKNGGRDGA